MSENNIINFSSEELTTIKEDIHQTFKKVLKNPFKKIFISATYMTINVIVLFIGCVLLITGGILAFLHREDISRVGEDLFIIFSIIGGILTIIASFFLFIEQTVSKKIKLAFQEHSNTYIKMAFKNVFNDVIVSNILTHFTLEPQNFLINGNLLGNKVITEKVLIGNINGQNFNCGTMLHTITQKNNKTYNRYLYFTCLINDIDFTTTIKPETLGSRIMGSNRGDQLESAEFEKLFALDYSDSVKLRKLLTPKVMVNMLNLANIQEYLPKIYINKNQVTLMFPYMNIGSPESIEGNLLNLILSVKEKQLFENVINMLNTTINLFINSYVWVSSLNLSEELIKNTR